MAFDIESLGGGAGGGIIGAILVALGFVKRVNKLEDSKQDKVVCEAIHKGIEGKINTIIEGQNKIWERLDNLNDYVRNQR